MTQNTWPSVFDGHNDMLLRLAGLPKGQAESAFINGRGEGHLDWPRMRQGGLCGGLFAVFVPPATAGSPPQKTVEGYDTPLPSPVGSDEVMDQTLGMISLLLRLERETDRAFRICRSVADIRQAIADDAIAAVLHFEGAEAIDPQFQALDVFYAAGLRSIGPVWSRPTVYGEGVPFRFPSTPDIGNGLTEAGQNLIVECNRRGIAIDLSHMNEKGFWDVAHLSDAPLIASHSNAHAVCPHARNLTDEQLQAVAHSEGIVGLNFATYFLRSDGGFQRDTPIDVMLDHLDHMIDVMGVSCVGLGSDFDGIAQMPKSIDDVASLPHLQRAMADRGYSDSTIEALCRENWLRVLERTWGG